MPQGGGTIPDDLSQLEAEAAKVLNPEALAYILAGAGDRDTMRANAAAFGRWKIKRHRAGKVKRRKGRRPAKVDLSTTVLGTRMPAPVLFAPIGVQTLAHPEAELATARAAAELGPPQEPSVTTMTGKQRSETVWTLDAGCPGVLRRVSCQTTGFTEATGGPRTLLPSAAK